MHTLLHSVVVVAFLDTLGGNTPALADSVGTRLCGQTRHEPIGTSSAQDRGELQKDDCTTFGSRGRLRENEVFSAHLVRGLELRLVPEGRYGWRIAVNPVADKLVDYVWPVSPPYQTAPHRHIGPVYGLTSTESVSFNRELRFVLTPEHYRTVFDAVTRRPMDIDEVLAMRRRVPTGTLSIVFTGFGVRQVVTQDGTTVDALDWIAFKGEACAPR